MQDKTEPGQDIEDTLAEGIAAVIAAGETLGEADDLADLFLEELNRLWAEPDPEPEPPPLD